MKFCICAGVKPKLRHPKFAEKYCVLPEMYAQVCGQYVLFFLETPMHSEFSSTLPVLWLILIGFLDCLLASFFFFSSYEKVFHCSLPLNNEDVVLHFHKEKRMKFEFHSHPSQNGHRWRSK